MITIPVKQVPSTDDQGNATTMLVPSTPVPANAIAVMCDGVNYTIYQPGDEVPSLTDQ